MIGFDGRDDRVQRDVRILNSLLLEASQRTPHVAVHEVRDANLVKPI